MEQGVESPPVIDMLGRLVLKQKLELRIIDLLVHDRCLKDGTFSNDKLDKSVDDGEDASIVGNYDLDTGSGKHPFIFLL